MSHLSGVRHLLQATGIEVRAGEFSLVSVSRQGWREMDPDRRSVFVDDAPFLVFSDPYEVTIVLGSGRLSELNDLPAGSHVEAGFRLLTFSASMDLGVVGFFAEVSRILATAGVPILALSSFSRDHLMIKHERLDDAVSALRPHVREIS